MQFEDLREEIREGIREAVENLDTLFYLAWSYPEIWKQADLEELKKEKEAITLQIQNFGRRLIEEMQRATTEE